MHAIYVSKMSNQKNVCLTFFDLNSFQVRQCLQRLGSVKPVNVCFRQEMDVLQVTLSKVRRTLKDLQLAIAGTIVMSDMLADALDAMFQAKVPQLWLKGAWFSPTVGIWFQVLISRYEQWDKWLKSGRPKTFWLPGFSNGQGFLTAMLQEVCAPRSFPVQASSLFHSMFAS